MTTRESSLSRITISEELFLPSRFPNFFHFELIDLLILFYLQMGDEADKIDPFDLIKLL